MIIKNIIIIYFVMIPFMANALQIDEKLTVRVLKLSSSKKTLLINRGIEDALAEGDHAKFYLTTGVVARAVLVKVSPSRSVWSVYKIIDSDSLMLDKVMNIKISTPVKLTSDRSKMLIADNTSTIPYSEDAKDDGQELSALDKGELESVLPSAVAIDVVASIDNSKTIETWGIMHFNGMSSSSDLGADGTTSGSSSVIDFSLGVEKYFNIQNSFLYDISFISYIHYANESVKALEGSEIGLSVFEGGIGINWHFFADPFSINRPIGFISSSFGIGTTTENKLENISSSLVTIEGASNFFSVGVGLKYYISNGFGAKFILDYYQRGELYAFEDENADFSKVVNGPRLQAGISYRW